MNYYMFLIPFITGFVSLLTTFLLVCIFLYPRKGVLVKLIPIFFNEIRALDNLKIQEELTPVLDEKIGDFLDGLSSQIPMGSMLLSGSFAETLKSKARGQILSMVPELKELAIQKGEKILRKKLEENWKIGIFKYGLFLSLIGGILGTILGAVVTFLAFAFT